MPADLNRVPSPEILLYARRPAVRAEHVPVALHRFAAPSGPWPWSSGPPSSMSLSSVESPTSPRAFAAPEWSGYPRSHFPNWTGHVAERSGLQFLLERHPSSETAVYMLDVLQTGKFVPLSVLKESQIGQLWSFLCKPRPAGVTLRCLFVGDVCGSILQMLGAKYSIEPFFFSSAINGIPSRYQETDEDGDGDHITITLPFVRAVSSESYQDSTENKNDDEYALVLDLQHPLELNSGKTLLLDQLAVHLIRKQGASTLIMLHPKSDFWLTTSAEDMYQRVQMAGKGIYWGKIWRKSDDPTFMLLVLMWHALYAWDESMDALFDSILTAMTKEDVGEIDITHELHRVRSALLLYNGLLRNFHNAVDFILNQPNPAYDDPASSIIFKRECEHLLLEVRRLQDSKDMCQERVSNALDLIFRTLTVRDTKAAQSQGWVTQQITFLTTVFLPPTFIATVFGMNLNIISEGTNGTLAEYLGISLPLIVVTGWLMLALRRHLRDTDTPFYHQLLWPFRDLHAAWLSWWRVPSTVRRHRMQRPASVKLDTAPRLRGWAMIRENLPDIVATGAVQPPLESVVVAAQAKPEG
ncbi:hypothetical protein AURDEDRAFT_126767 [Auricularia subglabra TFB-10046 SS5]|nr:hypothetical protein AURDEDRAFT_126767 [Auricularia subglabra TFB-10046 SS5]